MKNKVWNQEFSDRMMKHYGELKWLYMELYNSEEHYAIRCTNGIQTEAKH